MNTAIKIILDPNKSSFADALPERDIKPQSDAIKKENPPFWFQAS